MTHISAALLHQMWIFDQSDGSARLLKSRCGHGAPPTKVRFCTKGGQGILSAGLDCSLRLFTTVKDSSAKELSQGECVVCITGEGGRERSVLSVCVRWCVQLQTWLNEMQKIIHIRPSHH